MEKKCKNKKCPKILPEGYKYSYCENCRNKHTDIAKNVFVSVGGVGGVLAIGGIVLARVFGGNITSGGKA